MSSVIVAAGIMAGLGFFFAGVLAIAYRFLHVPEDPRMESVESMLPGTNCGACGEPGCHAFAEALLGGNQLPGGCTVSSPDAVEAIAEFLGVDPGNQEKRVARLHCAGGRSQALQIAAYEGYSTCRAAAIVSGGGKGCAWGCLGLGDCEVVCTFDAIHMNSEGLPVVDIEKCTACGDCVDVCPKNIFEILPVNTPLLVQCNVPLAGDDALELCRVACDACGRCAQDATPGLIEMVNNLPLINYSSQLRMAPEATFRCPTGAIQWVTRRQFITEDPLSGIGRRYAKSR